MSYWIAVVDDEPLSLVNAKNLLCAQDMRVSCLRSGEDLLEFVEKHTPDLILLDIMMPGMDGFETYHALRQYEEKGNLPQIPVIFLTGEDNSETERRGLKAGASDFIHKPFDKDILVKRIKNTIENSKTIESLTEEATLDRLTGFLNKSNGTEKVSGLCRTSSGALLIMDLDNFKLVNDLFGHDMGDRVLIAFAGVVRLNVRSDDVVCRIGGDEFMAFFPGLSEEEAIADIVGRLNSQLLNEADSLMGEGHGIPLGISVGVAFVSAEDDDFKMLFQYADSALYEVKRNGKHGYVVYDPDFTDVSNEDDLDRDLSKIIQIMSERGSRNGAMILGQDEFSCNYRFIERFLMRYGGTVTRIFFSISSDEGGASFSEIVTEFENVLRNTLRRSDMIHQWRQNRFLLVLPSLSVTDSSRVVERIMKAWKDTEYSGRADIQYTFSSVRRDVHKQREQ